MEIFFLKLLWSREAHVLRYGACIKSSISIFCDMKGSVVMNNPVELSLLSKGRHVGQSKVETWVFWVHSVLFQLSL